MNHLLFWKVHLHTIPIAAILTLLYIYSCQCVLPPRYHLLPSPLFVCIIILLSLVLYHAHTWTGFFISATLRYATPSITLLLRGVYHPSYLPVCVSPLSANPTTPHCEPTTHIPYNAWFPFLVLLYFTLYACFCVVMPHAFGTVGTPPATTPATVHIDSQL